MSEYTHPPSPRWGATIKLVFGLSFAVALGGLLVAFRRIIGPLLLAIILAYFFHPLVNRISSATRLSWRTTTTLIFLLVVILLLGFSTATGVVIVSQIESLFDLIRNFVNDQLPGLLASLSEQSFTFGPFSFDFSQFNLSDINQQFLNNLQSFLGQAGGLVGTIASGAAGFLGWTAFILLVAYFLLADAGRMPDALQSVTIPGYDYDVRRIARELGRIWNTYLRGQLLIIFIVMLVYALLLTILGVRYSLAIALLTGLARFVPYLGPLTVNLVTFLVTVFQSSNYFNLPQIYFAIMVVAIVIIIDQIFDNVVVPRVLGQTLGVHPAAVLISALLLAQMIGLVGLVLASPVLASIILVMRYTLRKLFELDPWPYPEKEYTPISIPWSRLFDQIRQGTGKTLAWLRGKREKLGADKGHEDKTAP
jgi:predicted PurR-regulated permease PerM